MVSRSLGRACGKRAGPSGTNLPRPFGDEAVAGFEGLVEFVLPDLMYLALIGSSAAGFTDGTADSRAQGNGRVRGVDNRVCSELGIDDASHDARYTGYEGLLVQDSPPYRSLHTLGVRAGTTPGSQSWQKSLMDSTSPD